MMPCPSMLHNVMIGNFKIDWTFYAISKVGTISLLKADSMSLMCRLFRGFYWTWGIWVLQTKPFNTDIYVALSALRRGVEWTNKLCCNHKLCPGHTHWEEHWGWFLQHHFHSFFLLSLQFEPIGVELPHDFAIQHHVRIHVCLYPHNILLCTTLDECRIMPKLSSVNPRHLTPVLNKIY